MNKKLRQRIPQERKIIAELQKEINSRCPFCNNTDAGHFQIHHIDENPTNNCFLNLILVCPNCHSKITKGDIKKKIVEKTKRNLLFSRSNIEFISVIVDKKCAWVNKDNLPYVFYNSFNNDKPLLPTLNFSFINHTKQVVVLNAIHIKAKYLYSGLSGIDKPVILTPSAKYKIPISYSKNGTRYLLKNQLAIPSEHPFQFQVQLFYKSDNEISNITGRNILYFTFIFNNKLSIEIPNIYLNCKSESEKFRISVIY